MKNTTTKLQTKEQVYVATFYWFNPVNNEFTSLSGRKLKVKKNQKNAWLDKKTVRFNIEIINNEIFLKKIIEILENNNKEAKEKSIERICNYKREVAKEKRIKREAAIKMRDELIEANEEARLHRADLMNYIIPAIAEEQKQKKVSYSEDKLQQLYFAEQQVEKYARQ